MKQSQYSLQEQDDMADFPDELNVKKVLQKVKMFLIEKQLKEDSQPNLVIPNLYIGCLATVLNKKMLLEKNISHILSVCEMPIFPHTDNIFKSMLIQINDSVDQEIKSQFDKANDFLHTAIAQGQNVLVHCFAGKSRSASFVIAYLIKYHQLSPLQALKLLQSKRPIAQPNMGFMKQIDTYYKDIQKIQPIQQQNENNDKVIKKVKIESLKEDQQNSII